LGSTFTTPQVATTRVRGVLPEYAMLTSRHASANSAAARNASLRRWIGAAPECAAWPTKRELVALDAHRAEHDAGRLAQVLEHRPLLDVQLEVGGRGEAIEVRARRAHAGERHAVLGQRVGQLHALAIDQVRQLGLGVERAGRRRRAGQAAAEPRALLVGPVDQAQRHRRLAGLARAPQHLEAGQHAERAVEPAAARHRVEVAADDQAPRRRARQRRPQVAGAVALGRDAQLALELLGEPRPRRLPGRAPGDALRALGVRGQRGQRFEIGDHPGRRRLHRRERTKPAAQPSRLTIQISATTARIRCARRPRSSASARPQAIAAHTAIISASTIGPSGCSAKAARTSPWPSATVEWVMPQNAHSQPVAVRNGQPGPSSTAHARVAADPNAPTPSAPTMHPSHTSAVRRAHRSCGARTAA
jgi:hypothetical protein